jgi:1,4-alpha-glucan branching enzyme
VNRVVGYHRWDTGGPQDDVLVIVNFSNQEFETEYNITLPLQGTWKVRFNSSWKGYSPEFHEIIYDEVTTDEHGQAPIKLAPYSVLILSQD